MDNDEYIECEKCGGEMVSTLVGDEHYMICVDCRSWDGS